MEHYTQVQRRGRAHFAACRSINVLGVMEFQGFIIFPELHVPFSFCKCQ